MRDACSGQIQCLFRVDYDKIPDPANGCEKDFSASYRCWQGEPLTTVTIPPTADYKTLNLSCAHPPDRTLDIVEATFGQNCQHHIPKPPVVNRFRQGNATQAMRDACSGQTQCHFRVDYDKVPDPANGCDKDFSVSYRCRQGEPLMTATIPPKADYKMLNLDCTKQP
jgi:hypothetical protein